MNKQKRNTAMIIVSAGLALIGLVLCVVSIFAGDASGWMLPTGLVCATLGNFLNFVRIVQSKKNQ